MFVCLLMFVYMSCLWCAQSFSVFLPFAIDYHRRNKHRL